MDTGEMLTRAQEEITRRREANESGDGASPEEWLAEQGLSDPEMFGEATGDHGITLIVGMFCLMALRGEI